MALNVEKRLGPADQGLKWAPGIAVRLGVGSATFVCPVTEATEAGAQAVLQRLLRQGHWVRVLRQRLAAGMRWDACWAVKTRDAVG